MIPVQDGERETGVAIRLALADLAGLAAAKHELRHAALAALDRLVVERDAAERALAELRQEFSCTYNRKEPL